MFGYAGRTLHVDLFSGRNWTEQPKEASIGNYIGGIGLGMRLLLDHCKPNVEPFSSENPLILATGPFSGTMIPTGGSGLAFITKSPLSFSVAAGESFGHFGAALKRAGYDAVILHKKPDKPVYLWIDDDSIQLMDARYLWGKSPSETERAIKNELNDFYIQVASIGLAGEKLVRIASISIDRARIAGRGGLGAVMGSKNLKAIAVRGSTDIKVADHERLLELVRIQQERMRGPASKKYRTLGTPQNILVLQKLCALPTKNFSQATFEAAEKVSGEYLNEHFVKRIIACSSCPMRCEHVAVVPEGPYEGTTTSVEYEPLWALGPNCGVSNMGAILKAIDLSNYYGVDATSIGGVISFAMELYEKRIIGREELGDLDLRFGNYEAMLEMIRRTCLREGFGNILAEGVRLAAEKIGLKAENYALHVKGVEMDGYDIRGLKTAALGYAVSFAGADHNRHGAYGPDVAGTVNRFKAERGRGRLVKDSEDFYAVIDSLMVCKFSKGAYYEEYKDLAALYKAVTGVDHSPEELRRSGERINVLGRLFSIREGLTRKDDTLPWKIMNVPIPDDCVARGSFVSQEDLDLMIDDYYNARGWTKDGVPSVKQLIEIGMDDLVYIVKGGSD